LLMLNALLLLLGAFMDTISAMVILVGVLGPLSQQIGIDPVQFGAMVVINFAIGMTTPPIGYALFVGSSVSGLSIEQVSRAIWPFLGAMIAVLLLITYYPPLTLWLPNLILGAAR
jgi:C4-dicarboxylate transporter, DctM subunit